MGKIADMLGMQGDRIAAQRETLGHGSGMTGDEMFGDTRPRFEPGPAWQARHAHPFTSQDATSAARALLNALGPEKAAAWVRALDENLRIEQARDRAQAAREAGL